MYNGYIRTDPTRRIDEQRIAHLYSQASVAFAFTLINASILGWVLYSREARYSILVWFSMLALVTVMRMLLAMSFYRSSFKSRRIDFWESAFLAGCAIAGMTWGSITIFLFPDGDIAQQMFVVFVLAGMVAGSVSVLSASLSAFALFSIPILLPLAFRLYAIGDYFSHWMSIMSILFFFGMLFAARGVNRTILSSLQIRFDNSELCRENAYRQRAEEALFQQKERLQTTLSSIAESVVITSSNARIEYLNPAAEELCGWSSVQAKGETIRALLCANGRIEDEAQATADEECLSTGKKSKNNILIIQRGNKKLFIEALAAPLRDRFGTISGAVVVLRDVTQEKQQSMMLAHEANHDALTSLPNRNLLRDRIDHAIAKSLRAGNLVAVLFIDLDRFKGINDHLGHTIGDLLLQDVAKQLCACLRQEDSVARIGGDEFVVVLEDLQNEHQASVTARKIVESLASPISIEGHEIRISASIGIALFPKDGEDFDSLMKNADIAMYRTKEHGGNNIEFYAKAMNTRAQERLKLERQLRQVVSGNELELFYQPRIDLRSGAIVGVEALLRWHNPDCGMVLPNDFIPLAEETGSILAIGEWVLNTACRQACLWHQNGHPDLRMAVNLSVYQIRHADIPALVSSSLAGANLRPEYLELEITESIFLKDPDDTIKSLEAIRQQGVQLVIDNFGTGYSSLAYLKRFPVDLIKVDRSFLAEVTHDTGIAAIVAAIISIGHGLNLKVVAEGVEKQDQLDFLKARQCDGFQGFYLSEPLSAKAMGTLLQNHKLH